MLIYDQSYRSTKVAAALCALCTIAALLQEFTAVSRKKAKGVAAYGFVLFEHDTGILVSHNSTGTSSSCQIHTYTTTAQQHQQADTAAVPASSIGYQTPFSSLEPDSA